MNSQDWMIGRSSISPGNPFRGAKRETPGRLISPPALRIMGRSSGSDTVDTPLPSKEYTDPLSGRRIAVGKNIVEKIIRDHYVSGEKKPGKEVAIRIDQTLTQDATGTMAYLQFEAMGVPRVKTELSVSYVDHNTLQYGGFENADDHRFLQTLASKYGIYFSKPGNGICHQVHLERFGKPGKTMLGSDSHTPTGGGIGMLAIGAGGLDVAVALGGGPF